MGFALYCEIGNLQICVFEIVQIHLRQTALCIIRILHDVVAADEFRHFPAGVARVRGVLLALFRALADACDYVVYIV